MAALAGGFAAGAGSGQGAVQTHQFILETDLDQFNSLQLPIVCPHDRLKAPSRKMEPLDYQRPSRNLAFLAGCDGDVRLSQARPEGICGNHANACHDLDAAG